MRWFFVVLLVFVSSCRDGVQDDVRVVTQDSEGVLSACVRSVDAASPSGEPMVEAMVQLDRCMSSTCHIRRNATCGVSRSGNTLTVEAKFQWTETKKPCTPDCGRLAATCRSEPLPPGEYELVLGASRDTLVVGSTVSVCVGASPNS